MIDEQKQPETTSETNLTSEQAEEKNSTFTSASEPVPPESATVTSEETELSPEETSDTRTPENIEDSEPASTEAEEKSPSELLEENEQIIATLQEENANLKRQLDRQMQQTNTLKAQYARLGTDFENFRRRTTKEKENLEEQAKIKIISDLLSVVDNFERARMQIKPANEGEKAIHNSYQGVYKTLVDSLKKMGVSAMRPEGQQFDPNFHEAMLREATDEHPEGTVLEQLMRGYLLNDKVLRHAMVKVAVPKEPVITSEESNGETEELPDNTEN